MKLYVYEDELYPWYWFFNESTHLQAIELTRPEYTKYLATQDAIEEMQELIQEKLHET